MSEIIHVALSKLVPWEGNVRKTLASEGIDELAASIAAHGLLQSLVVRPAGGRSGRGKFAVVAGQRRLLAMRALAKEGRIEKDFQVPCCVVEKDTDAAELSLAENAVRVPMHPADQFEAFKGLADRGMSACDIAARFGVSEITVAKRLKLGRLSEAVLAAYRAGEIGLEQAQAFAISDDHAAQDSVLASIGYGTGTPGAIRRALTEGEVSLSDKRVRFVGVEAYQAAGGAVRRDLFDDEDSGTILDAGLLERLVAEKLEAARRQVAAEGWQWTQAFAETDYETMSRLRRIHPERVSLSEEQQAEYDRLAEEYDTLADSSEADDGDAATLARLEQIQSRIDEMEALTTRWPSEALAAAGAVVTLSYDGTAEIVRGLIRPGDAKQAQDGNDGDSGGRSASPKAVHSAKLVEELTAHKSAAIAACLSRSPHVALASVVHALALDGLYLFGQKCTRLQISLRPTAYARTDAERAVFAGLRVCDETLVHWHLRIPDESENLWSWCLEQDQETLLSLLAFLAGLAVDAVARNGNLERTHADDLAVALGVDMKEWFTPAAANYFSRISSAAIIAAISEAKGIAPAPGWARYKKAELVSLAEREIAGTGWLPEPVRIIEQAAAGEAEEIEAVDQDAEFADELEAAA